MSDISLNYVVNSYTFKNYISNKTYTKFQNDLVFISKLKSKYTKTYSDSTEYLVEDCFLTQLGAVDIVEKFIKPSVSYNLTDISNIKDTLSHQNIKSTSFTRANKITDLSDIYNMSDNTSQNDNIIYNTSSTNLKTLSSILIKEDAMQLVTLTNLDDDVYVDEKLYHDSSEIIQQQQYDATAEQSTTLAYPKPFIGTQNIFGKILFNEVFPASYYGGTVSGQLYVRDVIFTPNVTAWYKLDLQQNDSTGGFITSSQRYQYKAYYDGGNYTTYYNQLSVYPDASSATMIWPGTSGPYASGSSYSYVYLTKDVPAKIRFWAENGTYSPDSQYIQFSLYCDSANDVINLTECAIIFENIDGSPIDTYGYNDTTYNISDIITKLTVQILNTQTQLLVFNTSNIFFTDYEKYAINKYCSLKLKFVNASNPTAYVIIKKSLEIKAW